MFLDAEIAAGDRNTPSTSDDQARDLAARWLAGESVSVWGGKHDRYPGPDNGSRHAFIYARVPLLYFDAGYLLNADFTARYCSVLVCTTSPAGEALLAFKLPAPLEDGKSLKALLRGLDVTYGGHAATLSAQTQFGFTVDGERRMLIARDVELDAPTIHRLTVLGSEHPAVMGDRAGYVRSGVTVAPDAVLTLESGESEELRRLAPWTAIFCPVHVDSRATAIVQAFAVGGPVVQCHHCQRVFPGRRSRAGYDFGLFDRTIAQLSQELPSEVTRSGLVYDEPSISLYTRDFLPTLDLVPCITFVKSPKGSGKTEALVDVVARCRRQRLRVLVIGHRRSLLRSLANRLGVENYRIPRPRAVGSDVDDYLAVTPGPYYAVCLDSLGRLDPKTDRYDVVIIDESEQVFAHLVGDTIREERRGVFARLKFYLDKAKHVFCLDADLNMITMQAAFGMLRPETPVRIVINRPPVEAHPYKLCATKPELIHELLSDVRNGCKCFVATNSKRQALDLERMLVLEHPGRRVITVTADNSQSRSVQELLEEIASKFRDEIDVLIASPAMGTGVDITFRDADGNAEVVVDRVFGVFEANITTHFDLDQHLMRVRHPREVKVWVSRTELNYETDAQCLKAELSRSVNRTELLVGFADDGTPRYLNDDGLTDIWAQVEAANRGSKNSLAVLFEELRQQNGWVAVDGFAGQDFVAIAERSQEASKKLRIARATRADEHAGRVAAASQIDEAEADELVALEKAEKPLTEAQTLSLQRYRIERFYREAISKELVKFDDEGRRREQVRGLELVLSDGSDATRTDLYERRSGLLGFDRQKLLARRELLRDLFAAADLMEVTPDRIRLDARVSTKTLGAFVQAVRARNGQINLLLGKSVRLDLERNPVGQLAELLALVGLELKEMAVKQSGGKKTREYGVAQRGFVRMCRILNARKQ